MRSSDSFFGIRRSIFWRFNILRNEKVRLKDVHLHRGEVACHKFMSGLVLRHDGEWIVVSLGNDYCLLVEAVISEEDTNIIQDVKVGDRFYTPRTFLDNALAHRICEVIIIQIWGSSNASQNSR